MVVSRFFTNFAAETYNINIIGHEETIIILCSHRALNKQRTGWRGYQLQELPRREHAYANGDGNVDAADIVEAVNFKLGTSSAKFIMAAADMNGDGNIDETDILQIVSIILGK